jgi:16S rRNA (adenine1518-N6/adenine1519-N6)-dimethyltransferase
MDVRALLREYGLRPKQSLGQNFLVDPPALAKIVAAAELQPHETVLEVGPGLGTLTAALAGHARRVVAVELDDRLLPVLERLLAGYPNVTVVHGDILALDPARLVEPPYKVVANIPYYITAAILRHLLEARVQPERVVLTVQAEVAERLAAQPGDMSLLAVSVQFYGRVRIVGRIKAGAFYPPPKVDSAVVAIDLRERPALDVADPDWYFRIVRAGFSQRRKQLKNTLAAGLARPPGEVAAALEGIGLDPTRRAETLSLEEWAAVARVARALAGMDPSAA